MTVLRIGGALASLLFGLAAGWSAASGAARLTTRPAVFLTAGLIAYAAVTVAAGWLLTRQLRPGEAMRIRVIGGGVAAALVLLPAAWTTLNPATPQTTPPPAGTTFWVLPDGSRIAALRVPGRAGAPGDPVVFLHGGPGVADMDHDAPILGRLAETGRDVWFYDQIGAGRSSRLADPTGYSLGRDLADLEQVRLRIGTPRMVLIGHSYGATLAAAYLARHPEHVSRVVFSSPGRLVPEVGDVSGTGMVGRLDVRHQLRVLGTLLRPRAMLTYSLLKVSPRAAHALSGDDEMDSRFATLYRQSAPGLVCPGNPVPATPERPGFYANQVPLNRSRPAPDIRPALTGLRVPALIVKGGCDYLPWSFVADYRRSLPGSELVYFDDCGHQTYAEHPERFLAVVTAFLADAPPPWPTWTALTPPSSYRGTA
ncbi:alpha/beta fold hydrolase [Micromonospora sp. NPDC050980]|uniref:alpha/beta fold hydrolase n=1 Tax=Micromonospora sp. NPDC050980 TaxID=3155161 RepID=UPI003403736E